MASSAVPPRSSLENDFPAASLSKIATRESWRKEVHRPATSTHKWWAKRLGSVFRGIITSALVEAGGDALGQYSSKTTFPNVTVFDPFGGSGITAVEALKLGCKAISFDINPVATLVQRQAVQQWDRERLTQLFEQLEEQVRPEIDRVHRTEDGRTVLYYFWVALAECPDCSVDVRLFSTPVFSKHAYPKKHPEAQIVCSECLAIVPGRYDFEKLNCPKGHVITPHSAVKGSTFTCPKGHAHKITESLGSHRPRYEMFAKMVQEPNGRKYYSGITEWDNNLYRECGLLLDQLGEEYVLPEGRLESGNNTNQALRWNFRHWRDFFNDRQLYSLSLLATAIRDLSEDSAEREALAALFSGTLEFNNLFTSFKGEGTGAVRHMFSNHVLRPERTPLEAHPWGTPQSSGSFSTLFKSRILRADDYKLNPTDIVLLQNSTLFGSTNTDVERITGISKPLENHIHSSWSTFSEREGRAYITAANSARTDLPNASVDLIVTDPPYMDNVHYSELADFFHAWLTPIKPFQGYSTEATTRQSGEVQNADPRAFGKAIADVWAECSRVLKPGGLLAFTFHQAKIEGWTELVMALDKGGFYVTDVQPITGEMKTSVVKAGVKEPSNLDSVVVCRLKKDGIRVTDLTEQCVVRRAESRLANLKDHGVSVGAGDVRSVVRGSLISYYIATNRASDISTELIDEVADRSIRELELQL